MSKLFHTILFTLTFGLLAQAQQYSFHFGGNYPLNTSSTHHESFNAIRLFQVMPGNDSLFIRRRLQINNTRENRFETLPGFAAGVRMKWPVGPGVWIESGLGIATYSFKASTRTLISEALDLPGVDTVVFSFTNVLGNGLNTCDVFIDNSTSIPEDDRLPHFHFIGLDLPLRLGYELVPGKMGCTAGLLLRTPLLASRKQKTITTRTETDDAGITTCTQENVTEHDKSGNYFRDVTALAEMELHYWLGEMGLSLSVNKQLMNTFTGTEGQFSTFRGYASRPIGLGVKVMYRLDAGG